MWCNSLRPLLRALSSFGKLYPCYYCVSERRGGLRTHWRRKNFEGANHSKKPGVWNSDSRTFTKANPHAMGPIWGPKSTPKSEKNRPVSLSKRLREATYNFAQIFYDFLIFFDDFWKVKQHRETTSIECRKASAWKRRTLKNVDFPCKIQYFQGFTVFHNLRCIIIFDSKVYAKLRK